MLLGHSLLLGLVALRSYARRRTAPTSASVPSRLATRSVSSSLANARKLGAEQGSCVPCGETLPALLSRRLQAESDLEPPMAGTISLDVVDVDNHYGSSDVEVPISSPRVRVTLLVGRCGFISQSTPSYRR